MSMEAASSNSRLAGSSDSDSDFDNDGQDESVFLGPDGDEMYELQELDQRKSHRQQSRGERGLDEDEEDDEGDDDDFHPIVRRNRRLSSSTAASFQLYTPDEERAVVRKFDRRLVLFLSVCYMMSFLDRSSRLLTKSFDAPFCIGRL